VTTFTPTSRAAWRLLAWAPPWRCSSPPPARAGAHRPAPPPRPAHEVALERLDRLGARLGTSDDLRPFIFELSEIIREYLGARFAFNSLELTTEELVLRLRRRVPIQEMRGFVLARWKGGWRAAIW